MEIGWGSQVLLGGAWDFLFLQKAGEEFTQRTQRCHRERRVKRSGEEKRGNGPPWLAGLTTARFDVGRLQ
jgi:hypothetical protein